MTPRQDLRLTRGEPFQGTIFIDGDQTLSAIEMTIAPRGAAADVVPVTINLTVDNVTGTGAAAITAALLDIPAVTVDTLEVGVVYVYRVRCDAGSSVAWGELHVGARWT